MLRNQVRDVVRDDQHVTEPKDKEQGYMNVGRYFSWKTSLFVLVQALIDWAREWQARIEIDNALKVPVHGQS